MDLQPWNSTISLDGETSDFFMNSALQLRTPDGLLRRKQFL